MISSGDKTAQAGFSLIEMIVAVGLFALIGIAGMMLVQSILTAQRQTETRLARLGQLQRALYLLTLDLKQASPMSLALVDQALVFTRRDLDAKQMSLSYAVESGYLVRTINSTRRQATLDHVSAASWRFHIAGSGWRDTPKAAGDRRVPDGIELDLTTTDDGIITRLIDLTAPMTEAP